MKIEITADRRVLQGTPVQIVQAMRELVFNDDVRALSVGEYIDWAAERAAEMTGTQLAVSGETDDARAASLIESMLASGLARRR